MIVAFGRSKPTRYSLFSLKIIILFKKTNSVDYLMGAVESKNFEGSYTKFFFEKYFNLAWEFLV